MTPFDQLVEAAFGKPAHPEWCAPSACTVVYVPRWSDRPEWVGQHSSEPVIVPSGGGEVAVCIAQFVDDDGPYPVVLRVDSDEMTIEQAERLAVVLTDHARRLREITEA